VTGPSKTKSWLMSEREILLNMGLASAVLAGVIFVYLVGGMLAVLGATFLVHHLLRRREAQHGAIPVDPRDPPRS